MAGVLNCSFVTIKTTSIGYKEEIQSFYSSLPNKKAFIWYIDAGWHRLVIGYKSNNSFGAAVYITYSTTGGIIRDMFSVDNGTWFWFL